MNKLTLVGLFSAMFYGSMAQAGDMGSSDFCCTAFFSAEGGYTWNSIDGYNFNIVGVGTNFAVTSVRDRQQATGRLAAGMFNLVDDQLAVTGELGWGYYGRTTLSPSINTFTATIPASLSTQYTLSGFDALLGVAWVQSCFNLSFKAGAVFQNMQTEEVASYPSFDAIDTITTKSNNAAVLPAIKLGAGYNFDSNWSITAAYMVAVGGTPRTNGTFNVDTLRTTLEVNTQNPTMNSFLIGVQYTV